MQDLQVPWPVWSWYWPAEHDEQLAEPVELEYVPVPHAVQLVAFAALSYPIAQGVQVDEPAAAYEPAVQLVQLVAPEPE